MTIDEDFEIPGTGAIFTFGKCRFAENTPSKFWIKNDIICKVACGDEHTAIITGSGRVFAIGNNSDGQLGLGNRKSVSRPSCIKGVTINSHGIRIFSRTAQSLKPQRVVHIACGRAHTIAATEIGSIFAWGNNGDGQLGTGNYEDKDSPVEILKLPAPPVQLAAGSAHSMFLTEKGEVFVWGSNKEGQLGFEKEGKLVPTVLTLDFKIASFSCGYYHSIAITDDGQLLTWGESGQGKLGFQKEGKRQRGPRRVNLLEKVVMSAAGSGHSLVLTESGNILSCGLGVNGQLGQGPTTQEQQRFSKITAKESLRFVYISAGDSHSAAIAEDGMVYTWGCGRHGKLCLGEQNFSAQFTPVLVTRLRHLTAVQVACGGCHTMVLGYRRSELGQLTRRPSSSGSLFLREARGFSEKMANQLKEMKTRPTVVKEIISQKPYGLCEEAKRKEENCPDPDESSQPLQDNYVVKEKQENNEENEESSALMRESKLKASRFARFWRSFIRTSKESSYSADEEQPELEKENPNLEDVESVPEKPELRERSYKRVDVIPESKSMEENKTEREVPLIVTTENEEPDEKQNAEVVDSTACQSRLCVIL